MLKLVGICIGSVVAIVAVGLSATPARAAVSVDGDLTEWGVTLNGSKQLVFGLGIANNPTHPGNTGTVDPFMGQVMYWAAEDQSDSAGTGGFLGPNHGGQQYDVEFMAAVLTGSQLYVAISTGQRKDNGLSTYSPGDLQIGTSNAGLFGLEMGGGIGSDTGAPYSTTIGLGDDGSTYTLNGSGFTTGHTVSDRDAGSVWSTTDSDWINDPINPQDDAQLKTQFIDGTLKGLADAYVYNQSDDLGDHAFIEIAIDLSLLLADGQTLDDLALEFLRWNPSCGNDELMLMLDGAGPGMVIPEPTSIVVWGVFLGFVGVAARRRGNRA